MGVDLSRELEVGVEAVRQAARLAHHYQGRIGKEVLEKGDKSPVTVADFAAQALICRTLMNHFPGDEVMGEEDADALRSPRNALLLEEVRGLIDPLFPKVSGPEICEWIDRGKRQVFKDRYWILDPIDGTKGFCGGRQFAVALGLLIEGKVELGILGCPNLKGPWADPSGVIFFARKGGKAWAAGLEGRGDKGREIRVSLKDALSLARVCESVEKGHHKADWAARVRSRMGNSLEPIRIDSQAKYGLVASGEAEVYLRLPSRQDYREKVWDHAAGLVLVEEAGGRVTDLQGQPLDFSGGPTLAANRGIVATNGSVHDTLLTVLAQEG